MTNDQAPMTKQATGDRGHWDLVIGPLQSRLLSAVSSLAGVRVMIVGVPKEVKQDEYRVAMLPVGVEELVRRGHKVLFEAGAGTGSGLPDSDYVQAGAEL